MKRLRAPREDAQNLLNRTTASSGRHESRLKILERFGGFPAGSAGFQPATVVARACSEDNKGLAALPGAQVSRMTCVGPGSGLANEAQVALGGSLHRVRSFDTHHPPVPAA